MYSYCVRLDVSEEQVAFVARLLRDERHRRGTRRGTRLLTCYKQAVFVLAWFRDNPDVERLGCGFGLSRATSYRYRDEGVAVLSAQAPDLHDALERARAEGVSHLILDGKTVECDRVRETTLSRKGRQIDAWYSDTEYMRRDDALQLGEDVLRALEAGRSEWPLSQRRGRGRTSSSTGRARSTRCRYRPEWIEVAHPTRTKPLECLRITPLDREALAGYRW